MLIYIYFLFTFRHVPRLRLVECFVSYPPKTKQKCLALLSKTKKTLVSNLPGLNCCQNQANTFKVLIVVYFQCQGHDYLLKMKLTVYNDVHTIINLHTSAYLDKHQKKKKTKKKKHLFIITSIAW